MLRLSSASGPGNLLRLAVHLLNTDPSRLQDAYELAMLAGVESTSAEVLVQVGELLAQGGRLDYASQLLGMLDVEKVYAENPKVKDLNARIGWCLYFNNHNYTKALEWVRKDVHWIDCADQKGRLSSEWQINMACILSESGDYIGAEKIVEQAYADDVFLKDGYARIAQVKRKHGDNHGSLALFMKDYDISRISPAWLIQKAALMAEMGNIENAISIVENAYLIQDDLTDGFSLIGWTQFLGHCYQNWKFADTLMMRDIELKRMSPAWKIWHACVKTGIGELCEAENLIIEAYSHPPVTSGYALIGFFQYLIDKDIQSLQKFINKDRRMERFGVMAECVESYFYAMSGEEARAVQIVERIYHNHIGYEGLFSAIGWLYLKNGDMIRALKYMDVDFTRKRMQPFWFPSYVLILNHFKRYDDVQDIMIKFSRFKHNNDRIFIGLNSFPDAVMKWKDFQQFVQGKRDISDLGIGLK